MSEKTKKRIFIEKELPKKNIISINNKEFEFNHLSKVLRVKNNELIELVLNQSNLYIAKIFNVQRKSLNLELIEEIKIVDNRKFSPSVVITSLKNNNSDLILQKATEIGVENIFFVNMDRTVTKISEDTWNKKKERYENILVSAASQSKQTKIPKLFFYNNLEELIKNSADYDYKFLAYEKKRKSDDLNDTLWDLTLNIDNSKSKLLSIFGPEGGFSENEVELIEKNNYKSISLGKSILRGETAPIYFLSVISFLNQR